METRYTSKDYTFKLDDKLINAYGVQVKVHPAPPGTPTGADVLLLTDIGFFLDVGNHRITLIPLDKSKQTITYNVIWLTHGILAQMSLNSSEMDRQRKHQHRSRDVTTNTDY